MTDAEEQLHREIDKLVKHGVVGASRRRFIVEEAAKHPPGTTAREIVDKLGLMNMAYNVLDAEEDIKKHLKEKYIFELKCLAKGIDGIQTYLVGECMRYSKGRVPPTLIGGFIHEVREEYDESVKETHPAVELLLSHGIPQSLLDEVETNCTKNDAAHQMDHVYGVVCLAESIIRRHHEVLECWRTAILLGALLHDVAHHTGRDNHHLVGEAMAAEMLNWHMRDSLSPVECRLALEAIREHRSSWKGKREHFVSQVVAAADLGVPNYERIVRRAMVYQIDRFLASLDKDKAKDYLTPTSFPETEKRRLIDACADHVREKFGEDGYSWASMSPFTKSAWMHEVTTTIRKCSQYNEVRIWLLGYGFDASLEKVKPKYQ